MKALVRSLLRPFGLRLARLESAPRTNYTQRRQQHFSARGAETDARIVEEKMVEGKTVNEIISTYKLPIPDLVNIAAEGLDLKVLEGELAFLRSASPLFGSVTSYE